MEKLKFDKWKLFDLIGYKVYDDRVRAFHDSEARVKVVCAPRRTTKSFSAAHDVLTDLLVPDARGWVVGPSYSLAEKEFRYIHDALVLNRHKLGLPKPVVCMTNHRNGNLFIKWPWGAVLEGKTAEKPDGLLGDALDFVIYSEAAQLKRGIRERYVKPALVTKKGRELIPTTPDTGAEWLYEEYLKGISVNKYPGVEAFSWGIDANPKYDRSEFEEAKKRYGEDSPVFREQYLGEWVFYGGLVYPMFSQANVIEPFDIPDNWPRIRAIDFGYRDPFVCLWGAVGPSGEVYIYREYYNRDGLPIRQHAFNIRSQTRKEQIRMTVGDPSAKQAMEDLCVEGIPCVSANNDRFAGRMRVSEYMMATEDGPAPFNTGGIVTTKRNPRMYIFNTNVELLRELKFFRWREGTKAEGDKEKTEGEDHACDAMRYLCMTRPSPFKRDGVISFNSFDYHFGRVRQIRRANELGMVI